MLTGFRDFLLRGNLIELATAVIMGTVFAAVVKAFTTVLLDIIGKVLPIDVSFSGWVPYDIHLGDFVTALISLVLTGFVVYFFIITPYNKLSELRKKDEPAKAASSEDLLAEIRDLLAAQNQASSTPDQPR